MIGADQTVAGTAVTVYPVVRSNQIVILRNTGSNDARYSFDGTSTPTATTGALLKAGEERIFNTNIGGVQNNILAIAVTGSTTINVASA